MIKKSITELPLHWGKAPYWLFNRMVKLSREIISLIIKEFGVEEVLKRISDPHWYQAFGCVLGFDWHSSGLTTTVNAALQEALKDMEKETGIFIAGGKGGKSRNTPLQIMNFGDKFGIEAEKYIRISKLTAKVDSVAIQDGYQLYLHHIFFTKNGKWAVVQQGLNPLKKYARRYHWYSDNINSFVEEPHSGIAGNNKEENVLNMTAKESREARETTLNISRENPEKILKEVRVIDKISFPERHNIIADDINKNNIKKILLKTYEKSPDTFENLLLIKGFGPKALRSLVLLSEIIFKKQPSYKDPITFSFAHGGKDGIPYPVNKKLYDSNIEFLKEILNSSKIEYTEKVKMFKRLSNFTGKI